MPAVEFCVPIMLTDNAQCRPVHGLLHASAGTGNNTEYLMVSSVLLTFVYLDVEASQQTSDTKLLKITADNRDMEQGVVKKAVF